MMSAEVEYPEEKLKDLQGGDCKDKQQGHLESDSAGTPWSLPGVNESCGMSTSSSSHRLEEMSNTTKSKEEEKLMSDAWKSEQTVWPMMGSEWEKKENDDTGNSFSSMFQSIAGEGLNMKHGGWGASIGSAPNMENQGKTESFNIWGGSGFSLNPNAPVSLNPAASAYDPFQKGWGMGNLKQEQGGNWNPMQGNAEKKSITEEDIRIKGGATAERKLDPIGPNQKRSASLTDLNVTFESNPAQHVGSDGVVVAGGAQPASFQSSAKLGHSDERSQPDGAEVSQQNREEMIAKMVNSNDGWGKKPIRQDTPWQMENSSLPPATDPLPAAVEPLPAVKPSDNSVFWNAQPETPGGPYWSGGAPAIPAATNVEWAPDSDIGVWNGPPPPESINPNVWTGPPKDGAGSVMWPGGLQVGGDKSMFLPPLGNNPQPWADNGSGFPGAPKDALDRGRSVEPWMAPSLRRNSDGGWMGTEVVGNSWAPQPSKGNEDFLLKQQQQKMGNPTHQPPPAFNQMGKAFDSKMPIGNWGEPAASTDIGFWNPNQAMQQPSSNMQQNPLQLLLELGLKKEEALQLLISGNVTPDKLIDLIAACRNQKEAEQPKGRMLRGKSLVEVSDSGNYGGSSNQFGGLFQNSRSSAFQLPGRGPSAFQPPISSGPQGFQKSFSQQGNNSWGGVGSNLPMHGRSSSQIPTLSKQMDMGGSGMMPPVMGQMSPMVMQNLLQLQSVLQPMLLERSQIQQNRNMTAQQKKFRLDQLNCDITMVKAQIEQHQMSLGPPPSHPDFLKGFPDSSNMSGGLDEAKTLQLLNQLKLDQNLGSSMGLPMMGGGDIGSSGLPSDLGNFLGSGNHWPNVDPSSLSQSAFKDKMPPGLLGGVDGMSDTWSSLAGIGGGSKHGFGDFSMNKGGNRPPPPPGLGSSDRNDMHWNQPAVNRSTSWAPGENKSRQGGTIVSNWLLLRNMSMLDYSTMQALCSQTGQLQHFFYNKSSCQVLACFREDANSTQNKLGSFPGLSPEVVSNEEVSRLMDPSNGASWIQIPVSNFGGNQFGGK